MISVDAPTALRRVGLIVNSAAGRGGSANLAAAADALRSLEVSDVVTGPGDLGEAAAGSLNVRIDVHDGTAVGRAATQELTRQLVDVSAADRLDAILVVGGDGTLADVALELADLPYAPALLGIGVGSANAGGLVTCRRDEVAGLSASELVVVPIDGLLVTCPPTRALAFNDVTVASTVVGSEVTGEWVDLDSRALLQGHRRPGTPRPMAAPTARVRILTEHGERLVASGVEVGGLAVGLLDTRFVAKAVAGPACLAVLGGLSAGCVVSESPLIRARIEDIDALTRPQRSVFVGLTAGARLEIDGLAADATLCADGNPLAEAGRPGTIGISLWPQAVRMLRRRGVFS